MASIVKRGKSVAVVYTYRDLNGRKKQKWETVAPENAEARKREIELDILRDELVLPQKMTVEQFIYKWVETYAPEHWAYNTYASNLSIIRNHIIPYIGSKQVQEITQFDIENLYNILRKVRVKGAKSYNKDEEDIPYLSSTTIRNVHGILVPAFEKAVDWGIIRNTPIKCDAPKKNKPKVVIWTPKIVSEALSDMQKESKYHLLRLALHTSFIATSRNGETVGLTWDCIEFDNDRLVIDKTLQRINKKAFEFLPKDDLIFVFPEKLQSSKSILVLKEPKTETSKRFLYMTAPLKKELLERKKQVELEKQLLGSNYNDYNLVFCHQNGDPIEPKLLERWFKKWQHRQPEGKYPEIVFHGIRHSSITYKLYMSRGDYKAVQGDSGHATSVMVTDEYAHMEDKRRLELSQKVEAGFYRTDDSPVQDDGKLAELIRLVEKLDDDDDTVNAIINLLSR